MCAFHPASLNGDIYTILPSSAPVLMLLVQYCSVSYRIYSHFLVFSTTALLLFQDPVQNLILHLVIMPLSVLQAATVPQFLLVFDDLDILEDKVCLLCRKNTLIWACLVFSPEWTEVMDLGAEYHQHDTHFLISGSHGIIVSLCW